MPTHALEVTQSLLSTPPACQAEKRHGGACGSGNHQHARRRGVHQRRWVVSLSRSVRDRHQRRGVARYACRTARRAMTAATATAASVAPTADPAVHWANTQPIRRPKRIALRASRQRSRSREMSACGRRTHHPASPAGRCGQACHLRQQPGVRAAGLFAIFAVVLFFLRLVACRSSWGPDYSAQAQAQRTSYLTIERARGTIYDRNGVVLATSVDATNYLRQPPRSPTST